jgi:hypothetical protein
MVAGRHEVAEGGAGDDHAEARAVMGRPLRAGKSFALVAPIGDTW